MIASVVDAIDPTREPACPKEEVQLLPYGGTW